MQPPPGYPPGPPGYPPGPPGYPPGPPGGPPGYGYPPPPFGGAPPPQPPGPQYPYGSPPGGMGGPPQKQGPSIAKIALIVLVAFVVLMGGGCLTCFCVASRRADREKDEKNHARHVAIRDMLQTYRTSVARGDDTYKGKWVIVQGGYVSEVDSASYFTVGTGKSFEFPELRCNLSNEQVGKISTLTRGRRVTVRGKGGGMTVHVLLNECEIL